MKIVNLPVPHPLALSDNFLGAQDFEIIGGGAPTLGGLGISGNLLAWNTAALDAVRGNWFIPRDVAFSFAQVYWGHPVAGASAFQILTREYQAGNTYDAPQDGDFIDVIETNAINTVQVTECTAAFDDLTFGDLNELSVIISNPAGAITIEFIGIYIRIEAS